MDNKEIKLNKDELSSMVKAYINIDKVSYYYELAKKEEKEFSAFQRKLIWSADLKIKEILSEEKVEEIYFKVEDVIIDKYADVIFYTILMMNDTKESNLAQTALDSIGIFKEFVKKNRNTEERKTTHDLMVEFIQNMFGITREEVFSSLLTPQGGSAYGGRPGN